MIMPIEITLPIKCSTYRKIRTNLPWAIFIVAIALGDAAFGALLFSHETRDMYVYSIPWPVRLVVILWVAFATTLTLLPIGAVATVASRKIYDMVSAKMPTFKCIQDEEP